jgi:succinoglycan biosynthesis protein ExoA
VTEVRFHIVGALDASTARVAVVMPVRNEAAFVAGAIDSVLAQTFDPERLEILVVDGDSTDGTVEIAEQHLSGSRPSIARVLSNHSRTTPSGLNTGISSTSADVVIRVDGHCRLAPDYIETCVRLLAETGAGNVGGRMRPKGEGAVGQAMTLALSSKFGIGDSRFHYSERQEFVDTVYLGAFRRSALAEVGGYDESLLSNEDFELNHRLRSAGYGVLLSPDVQSTYIPRNTVIGIAQQFDRYGRWKASVMRKHPQSIRPRHLIAPSLVAAMCAGSILYPLTHRRVFLSPFWLYGIALVVATIVVARPRKLALPLLAVFPAMHLSWGAGVLRGLVGTIGLSSR